MALNVVWDFRHSGITCAVNESSSLLLRNMSEIIYTMFICKSSVKCSVFIILRDEKKCLIKITY